MKDKTKVDIHQAITDKLVAAMEAGAGKWRMPWAQPGGAIRPMNVSTGNFYRGINVIALWVEATDKGYSSNVWGTYRQWEAKGAQVRKGEKSALSVFFKPLTFTAEGQDDRTVPMARATPVFTAEQVDGYEAPAVTRLPTGGAEAIAAADLFVAKTGAEVVTAGSRAFYTPSADRIQMPMMSLFTGSETSSASESYYSTLLHELVHWTGAKSRVNRDLSGRFGTDAYAMEELVAEIGAAFLCSDLGISVEPRPDHAQYLSSWLKVLKGDRKAVFTAASKASQAFDFLELLQGRAPAADMAEAA
jgi:antirestriction protein ArdC